jgi:predicted nucleic acid-binding Zn ribbon protein
VIHPVGVIFNAPGFYITDSRPKVSEEKPAEKKAEEKKAPEEKKSDKSEKSE